MRLSQHLKMLRSCLIASILGLCALPSAFAARDFTPQAGTWIISSENNGQPGRGLAIDVQGNTLFLQVYGYEKNGDSTFYIAAGKMDGNRFTGPLTTYSGGQSFGSSARDAELAGSPGDVSIEFKNGLQGTIQFPGEKTLEIERFIFTRRDAPFYKGELWKDAVRTSQWFALDTQGEVLASWLSRLYWTPSDPLQLVLSRQGGNFKPVMLECIRPDGSESLQCTLPSPLNNPSYYGTDVKAANFRIVGQHVTGNITLNSDGAAPLKMMGFNTNSTIPDRGTVITGCCSNGLESFVPGTSGYFLKPIYVPTNGAWIIEDELTGKPGRGMNLDVQGNTLVVQVFGYTANGKPTFYLGAAPYVADDEGNSKAQVMLRRYAGGSSFGGTPAIASVLEDSGLAMVTLPPTEKLGTLAIGEIQLPGEPVTTMKRLPLAAAQSQLEQMLGEWYVYASPKLPRLTMQLSRIDGNAVTNEDGTLRCTPVTNKKYASCNWFDPATNVTHTSTIGLLDDFSRLQNSFRLRDRHGNLLGLGDIPLD